MSKTPRFSIVTPVYRPRPDHLQETIDSVREQEFTDWEWILVDDASKDPGVTRVLRKAAESDPRITVIEREENGHIVAASNDGLAAASGEWIVLLDHDDLLAPQSLLEIDEAIVQHPGAGYVYSDEDKVDDRGVLSGAFQKPDWSPERLRHQMYLGHLSALRHDLVKEVGGFRQGFDGSQDHDLALRVTELADEVVHVPQILYHWRMVPGSAAGDPGAKDYATEAGIRAVQEHLHRVGRPGDIVERTKLPHTYAVKRSFSPNTRVSVVIPTRGGKALVWGKERTLVTGVVESLLTKTNHSNLEIVVVYDVDTPEEVLDSLRDLGAPNLILRPYDRPFNFSEKCNLGYLASTGDVIIFLNDDMEIMSDNFVENLCAPLEEPDVGLVGARLTFEDGRIQHAGLAMHDGNFVHAYLLQQDDDEGYFRELVFDHEVSGLTAACVAVRRDVFAEVGGFNIGLPSNFNDVDLCLKVRERGYRLIWLADVRAAHFESMTRDRVVHRWEVESLLDRWGEPNTDPYMPHEAARMVRLMRSRAARAIDSLGVSAKRVARKGRSLVEHFRASEGP